MRKIIKMAIICIILLGAIGTISYKTTYCFMTIGEKQEISFNTMGGTPINNIIYNYGINTLTNKLPTPTKNGYNFKGWYLEKEYVTKINDIPYPNFSNDEIVTLYAKWELPSNNNNFIIIGISSTLLVSLAFLSYVIITRNKKTEDNIKKE